jgi:hypothetical protein
MAHADNSIITRHLTGSIGKQLVFRQWEGKTIVAKSPNARKGNLTAAQLEAQEKFQMASRYSKAVIADTDQSLAEGYQTSLKPRQNLYSRAMEDFMNPPVVKPIDTRNYHGVAGDTIVVRAVDDFRVTGVRVEIFAADGSLLEAGNAIQQSNGIDWKYAATQANALLVGSKIRATAADVPGNETIEEKTL